MNMTASDAASGPSSTGLHQIVIVGGGPIAIEMAQGFNRLGLPTTVLQKGPGILPRDEPELVQILRQRPAQALPDRPLDVVADGALGDTRRGGDPLVTEFRLELEAQNLFDLAHGTPLGWHRAPLVKIGQLN